MTLGWAPLALQDPRLLQIPQHADARRQRRRESVGEQHRLRQQQSASLAGGLAEAFGTQLDWFVAIEAYLTRLGLV